ncbi:MAG: hypothetical protein J5693_03155 [Bacteroidales bacterium]|nr:hypothetical protein [Bacteroidales bacterium]
MINFIGEYKAKVDDKGRLVFPAAFKAICGESLAKGFVVKKTLFANCLEMYTYESWEKESEAVRSRLNFFNRDDERFWRAYTSSRTLVVPDEKLGRISIPKELLESVGIEKEAVFCGRDFKIEIWAKDSLDATNLSDDDYVALAEKTLG